MNGHMLLTLIIVVVIINIVVWINCFIDIISNEFTGNNKIIWLIVILTLPIIGEILYIIIGKSQQISNYKKNDDNCIILKECDYIDRDKDINRDIQHEI